MSHDETPPPDDSGLSEEPITDADQWTEDAEDAAESVASEEVTAGGEPPAATDWPDLDAYAATLRAEHAVWTERLAAVRGQLAGAAALLGQIERQYHDLGVEDDLAMLREHVLGGVGAIQHLRFDFDLERYAALAWPVAADPRPEPAAAHPDGEYMVAIWFGMGTDGRASVRVEGEKRLEAPLPTTRERLRSVLLRAMQAPRWSARPGGDDGESSLVADGAVPEPGEGAPDTIEPAADPPQSPAEATTARGAPEDLPAEEMVIPLGPAERDPTEAEPG